MPYSKELAFLQEVAKRCHVATKIITSLSFQAADETDLFGENAMLSQILPTLQPQTLYKFTAPFDRCYRLLLLPNMYEMKAFCIGPFLVKELSEQRLLEIGEAQGISPQKHSYRYLKEYYAGLPVLEENGTFAVMLHTFCEKIWDTPTFRTKDITKSTPADTPCTKSMRNLEASDTLLNKKAIEQRYAFENEMLRAVSLGLPNLEKQFEGALSEGAFEKRAADPLRNAKNYGIIMNTLLRKAAEKGGVHPVYIDQTSSDFAQKLEKAPSLSAVSALMKEMFRTYCRLVRRHSLRQYSPVVQKSILIIDADLSADLSPKLLAQSQGITLVYLSSVFKKETGKTLSEYIRQRRMEYAAYLLETTNLQVQTISLHCGIMDAQYFSKLFKQTTGKTPLQYRRSSQNS